MNGTPPASPSDRRRRARLRWRCRCGLRELDILLARFLESQPEALGERELEAFEALLDQPPLDLLGWLTGQGEPDDPELAALCARIRALR